MKKISYIIFAMLLYPLSVNAATYYSPYSDYSEYTKEEVTESELLKVEKTKFYQAYKEHLEYVEEKNQDATGNIKYENQKWVEEKPDLILETKKKYSYYEFENNRYFKIENTSKDTLTISLLIIDNTLETNNIILRPNESYIVNIEDDRSAVNGINMQISSTGRTINYRITLNSEDIEKIISEEEINSNSKLVTIYPSRIDDIYKEPYELDEEIKINGIVKYKEEYLTADIFYETLIKEYLDLYLNEETEEYKIDKKKFIYYYRFKTREKLTLKSNIIEDKKINIEDLIESTTEYKIITDINYLKNGVYTLKIITPYKIIDEKITIDIKQNLEEIIKEQLKEIETIQENLDIANYKIEKKNQEIKEIINSSNDTFLANEVEKLKISLKDIEEKKEELDEVNTKKTSAIILVIGMTILLIISLLKDKKNV